MNKIIYDAIKNRQRLQFNYNGTIRVVEPQCYGIRADNNEILRAYQVSGPSQEKLFVLSNMTSLEVLDEKFTEPGPNYKKGDSAMKTIFYELDMQSH